MKLYWLPLLLYSAALHAAPEGFACKSGDASHTRADVHTIVQSSGRSVVHWDSFSLGPDEILTFDSPAILNRVVGGLPSEIHGAIHSTGAVWLVNQNGIVIGREGRINAANFLASTLDLLDSDFLGKNEFLFSGGRARIEQNGVIECPNGYVMLMSSEGIEQSGTIRAARVGLGVGAEILFVPKSSPLMAIRLKSVEDTPNYYSKAIQHKGLIEAQAMEERGGEVYLIAERLCEVTGEIFAEGGTVHVLGEEVVHTGKACIDISGKKGGGTLLIGGDYQGKNPDIRNAKRNWLGPEVEIFADALEKGNGGRVIFWADEVMHVHGNVSVRGGKSGGDGGFVEISGKQLDFRGLIDRRAANGRAGMLLFDQCSLVISNDLPNSGSVNTIHAKSLGINLNVGDVTINASSMGDGVIAISSPITWMADTTLTLQADAQIVINAAVSRANRNGTTRAMSFTVEGRHGGTNGIQVSAPLSAVGNEILLVGTGGEAGGCGVALAAGGGIDAPMITIIAAGGKGAVAQRGFDMTGGFLGGATTQSIAVTGMGGGRGAGNDGIRITEGTIQTNGGLVTLNGTGGGSGNGASNVGVRFEGRGAEYLDIGQLHITGRGGVGSGGANCGVNIAAPVCTTGEIRWIDCMGGIGGSHNHGLQLTAAATASKTILCNNISGGGDGMGMGNHGLSIMANGRLCAPMVTAASLSGGKGTSANYGFFLDAAGILGSDGMGDFPGARSIYIEATGGGSTGDNAGILLTQGVVAADRLKGGAFTFVGMGKGAGIRLGGITFANANTISFTGVGERDSSTAQHGVEVIYPAPSFKNLAPREINFLNCFGGESAAGGNCGLSISSDLLLPFGTISLSNIRGGTSDTGNCGVHLTGTLAAVAITGIDIAGGMGTDGNHGFYLHSGTLGSSQTSSIAIAASGGGTGAKNYGIFHSGGEVHAAGAATFDGTGGGTVGDNYGIFIAPSTTYSPKIQTLTFTGKGGGGSASHGVCFTEPMHLRTDLVFRDCKGGTVTSRGVSIESRVETLGSISIFQVEGGTSGNANYGFYISPTGALIGKTITGAEIVGGRGLGSNHGFYLHGGTLGSSETSSVSIAASGGGTGAKNYGIFHAGGEVLTGAKGIAIFCGTGGGTVRDNCGIFIDPPTAYSTEIQTLTFTGKGGRGFSSHGVRFKEPMHLRADLVFRDCKGGSAVSRGVSIENRIETLGNISIFRVEGGASGNANYGFYISPTGALIGATITGAEIVGGGGIRSNHGFYLNGGTLGSPETSSISIAASGRGTGANNCGIFNSGGAICAVGSVTLIGAGSDKGLSGNHGILTQSRKGRGNFGGITSLTLTGVGGGGNSHGVQLGESIDFPERTRIAFSNCAGGTTGRGVSLETAVATLGDIVFSDIRGGASSIGNCGVYVSSAGSLSGATITATQIAGGMGSSNGHGFYISGGEIRSFGNLDLTAKRSGTSSSAIRVDSGGVIEAKGNLSLSGDEIHLTGAFTKLWSGGDIALASSNGTIVDSGVVIEGAGAAAFKGALQIGASRIAASGTVAFCDAITLIGSPQIYSTASGITFNAPIDGAFVLHIDDATTLTFAQAVGAAVPLAGLDIGGSVDHLRIDSDLIFNGSYPLAIPSTTATCIGGSSRIKTNSQRITWNGAIDGAQDAIADLILSSSGGILVLGGDIGVATPLHSFIATGPTFLKESLHIAASEKIAFASTLNGTTAGSESLTLSANSIVLSAAVGNTIPPRNLTIVHKEIASIEGGIALEGSFSVGPGRTHLNGNISAPLHCATFAGPVDVIGEKTIAAENILFQNLVNGPGGLTLLGSTATFAHSAGASIPLDSIDVTVTSVVIGGDQVVANRATYAASVAIDANVTIANRGQGKLIFEGPIATRGNFTAQARGDIAFFSQIDANNGGNVKIESTEGSIWVTGIDASSTTGAGGSIFLQPSGALTSTPFGNLPNGTITLGGDLVTTGGALSLAPNSRSDYPSVATIFSPESTHVTLQGGSLLIGPQEAVTILGNFTVELENAGWVGDLVVQGNLNIGSTSLLSYRRDPIPILGSDGALYLSPASHIVYQEEIVFAFENLRTYAIKEENALSLSDLRHLSYTLNFDPEAEAIPAALLPLSIAVRENDLSTIWTALSEMGDRLPLYRVKKVSAPICLEKRCFYKEESFESFLPENSVK